MLEFFGGLFTAYVLTWQALGLLILAGILFEHSNWRGFAVFTALFLGFSAASYFQLSWSEIAMYAGGSLAFGLVWSFWRYKRFVDAKVLYAQTCGDNNHRKRIAEEMRPSNMWPTIVAWVVVWPFSIVESAVGDIISAVETIVKKVFRGVYNRIYTSAVAKMNLQ